MCSSRFESDFPSNVVSDPNRQKALQEVRLPLYFCILRMAKLSILVARYVKGIMVGVYRLSVFIEA